MHADIRRHYLGPIVKVGLASSIWRVQSWRVQSLASAVCRVQFGEFSLSSSVFGEFSLLRVQLGEFSLSASVFGEFSLSPSNSTSIA